MPMRIFADRREAGEELSRRLVGLGLEDPVVLALPRGGVPVALEIARALKAPVDLVLVRKIGVPHHREVAAAAVVDGGDAEIVFNRGVMRSARLDEDDIRDAAQGELAEIERRRSLYLGRRKREPLEGRTLIVVDDGIATGATMKAAVAALLRKNPRRIIVAVPVAAPEVIDALGALVDTVICPEAPEDFEAVGMHYHDFHQVTDAEVMTALDAAEVLRAQAAAGG